MALHPDDEPRYRSGAVARMLRMPVATLRVWERRYRVGAPQLTPSGQRLYSASQVRRIALLKQLTDHGHAIGTLAALSLQQLAEVARTHANLMAGAALSGAPATPAPAPAAGPAAAPPRRWDDATLADVAGLSSTIACECPQHLAGLILELSRFEAYSAECAHRSPADAELHAYLQQVAAASRAQLETALERVAVHEGLLLPR